MNTTKLRLLITPNAITSRQMMLVAWAVWIAMIFLLWSTNPSKIIPGPGKVLAAFGGLVEDEMLQELWTSIEFNMKTLCMVVTLSLSMGYFTALPIVRPGGIMFATLRFLGPVGFVFLFTLIMPNGHWLKIALLLFAVAPMLTMSVIAIREGIDRKAYEYARTLRMGPWQEMWEVVVLGTRHQVADAIINSSAMGWMMLTLVEGLVRSEGGLGVMLLNSNKHLMLAEVYALQSTVYLVGMGFFFLLVWMKRKSCPYAVLATERRAS